MKKRIISVLLVTAMILSCGCKKKEKEESSESTESTTESTTEKTESVTEPSPLVTDTEPEEFAFDKTNIPGIQFCYSTASMAISAYSVLLDISRHEASELILDKGFNATYDYGESGVALLPAICLDDSFETFYEAAGSGRNRPVDNYLCKCRQSPSSSRQHGSRR